MKMVEKTLDILEVILNYGGEVGLTELANITGLHISTIRRFTSTLVKRGYLYQRHRGGDYSFGLKFLQFSDSINASINVKDIALPYLKKLSDEISQPTALAMINGLTATDIVIVCPENTLRVVPNPISNLPLYCSSAGKIFLAYMPDKKLDHLIETMELKSLTPNTITDWNKLMAQIEKIRHDDVAYDREEFISGVSSIASPVKGENGKVLATFSVVSPSSIITSLISIEELASKLKSYAQKASRSFGYTGK